MPRGIVRHLDHKPELDRRAPASFDLKPIAYVQRDRRAPAISRHETAFGCTLPSCRPINPAGKCNRVTPTWNERTERDVGRRQVPAPRLSEVNAAAERMLRSRVASRRASVEGESRACASSVICNVIISANCQAPRPRNLVTSNRHLAGQSELATSWPWITRTEAASAPDRRTSRTVRRPQHPRRCVLALRLRDPLSSFLSGAAAECGNKTPVVNSRWWNRIFLAKVEHRSRSVFVWLFGFFLILFNLLHKTRTLEQRTWL